MRWLAVGIWAVMMVFCLAVAAEGLDASSGQAVYELNGKGTDSWEGIITLGQPKEGDIRTQFMLWLTQAQMNSLTDVHFDIYEKEEDGYALISAQRDVDREGLLLLAEAQQQSLFILDASGKVLTDALPFMEDVSGLYSIKAELIFNDAAGTENQRVPVLLNCTREENDNLVIQEILLEDTSLTAELTGEHVDPEQADAIEFTRENRKPVSINGGQTLLSYDQWELSKSSVYRLELEGDWHLSMRQPLPAQGRLYASFTVQDDLGCGYASALAAFEEKDAGKNEEIRIEYQEGDALTLQRPAVLVKNSGSDSKVVFTVNVTNVGGNECFVIMENVEINEVPTNLESELYGMGDYDGIVHGETQTMMLTIPASLLIPFDAIETLEFDLAVLDAETEEEIDMVSVGYRLNQSLTFMPE